MKELLWQGMDNKTRGEYKRLISKIGGLTSARKKLLLDAQEKAGGYTRKIQESRAELKALGILDKGDNNDETK